MWLQTRRGLRFDHFGQAFSTEPWAVNAGHAAFTVQFWLRPAEADNHALSPILSIYGSSPDHNLDLAQSGTDLVLEGYFRTRDGRVGFHQLWLDSACSTSLPIFVTIASGENGTDLYWADGSQSTKHYPDLRPSSYFGRLLIGHSPEKRSAWSGDIYGLAFLNRVITEDIQKQYMEWVNGNPTRLGATARYIFDDRGNLLHNRAGSAPDLVIPPRYRPLTPTVLEFPKPFKLSDVEDSIVNILGFIPFGLFLMCYFVSTNHTARDAFVRTIIVGALTSLGIELLQVFLPTRDSSILDVINNVLGTVAGASLETLGIGLWPPTLG